MNIKSKALLGAIWAIGKGIVIPVVIGAAVWAIKYPLGAYDCYSYGYAKDMSTKYVWFQCYVKDNKKQWLTLEEYRMSEIGTKIIMTKGVL